MRLLIILLAKFSMVKLSVSIIYSDGSRTHKDGNRLFQRMRDDTLTASSSNHNRERGRRKMRRIASRVDCDSSRAAAATTAPVAALVPIIWL